ncbi:MAG: carboxypeptidase-like regulatory domain-containing protein [Bryobacteraceae bacterium]
MLYGSITGNVTDATGAAVSGATVEALNIATGVSKRAAADARGVYLISDLQTGQYKVSISATSFATVVQTGVTLEANTVRRVDAQMQVAQVNQTVTVDASAAVLQTDRADVNTQVGQAEIANLPIGGQRVFQSLYKLVPGSSPPAGSHSEAGNPQGALAVNVNGVSNTTTTRGSTEQRISTRGYRRLSLTFRQRKRLSR